ncbi:extracellular solute-binding protein [Bacillus sp. JCM 19041]|uniref:ABC transporter substrate-binding protein n=1 Tax=Bacillus sp. JCM 19041 TaxID=1460637 RepID=UPI0006D0C4DA
MRKNRNEILFAAVALCTLAIGGCQTGTSGDERNDDDVLRVAWWGGQERHTMTIEMIELFEEKYPDITVEPEYTAWDNYWERLTTQAAGSNLPDVVQMDNSKLNEYISRSLIKDLSPFIDEGVIDLSNVDDAYQDINTVDSAVYGISLGSNALGVVYNQELFDEHGIELEEGYTYEDLKEKMRELGAGVGDGFYGYDLSSEFELFSVYARQSGESVFNEAGEGLGYTDETLIAFFEFVTEMLEEDLSPPHEITMEYIEGGESTIAGGLTGMGLIASNQIIGQQALTEEELSLSTLPALDGGLKGIGFDRVCHFQLQSIQIKKKMLLCLLISLQMTPRQMKFFKQNGAFRSHQKSEPIWKGKYLKKLRKHLGILSIWLKTLHQLIPYHLQVKVKYAVPSYGL